MVKKRLIMIILSLILFLSVFSIGYYWETQRMETEMEVAMRAERDSAEEAKRELMLTKIKQDVSRMEKITEEEAKVLIGNGYTSPKYVPKRFVNYGTYMIKGNYSDEVYLRQVWYDSEKFELFYVTQVKQHDPQEEFEYGEIVFTDTALDGEKIIEHIPWATYMTSWDFVQNGISVQGYMLVNDENNRDEYNKMLKSVKQ